jgi:hypothetical protein
MYIRRMEYLVLIVLLLCLIWYYSGMVEPFENEYYDYAPWRIYKRWYEYKGRDRWERFMHSYYNYPRFYRTNECHINSDD